MLSPVQDFTFKKERKKKCLASFPYSSKGISAKIAVLKPSGELKINFPIRFFEDNF